MSHTDYLGLDAILSAQRPLSDALDEIPFIVRHQTSELWMRLALQVLGAARAGLPVPAAVLCRDVRAPWTPHDGVKAARRRVCAAPEAHWEACELAEKLVDFADYFRRWRFNHVTTVERVIGLRRGSGGTAGVSYLRRMLEVELFPELWRLRTDL